MNTTNNQQQAAWASMIELFFNTDTFGRRLPKVSNEHGQPITGPWRYTQFDNLKPVKRIDAVIATTFIAQHISGVLTHGNSEAMLQVYAAGIPDKSRWTTIDLDVAGDAHAVAPEHFATETEAFNAAVSIVKVVKTFGLTPHVERTKSRGYRVWIFHDCTTRTADAHQFGKLLIKRAELHPATEVFPKELWLSSDSVGSAVFLPYCGLNTRNGRQVMIGPDGSTIDVYEWIAQGITNRTPSGRIAEIVKKATVDGEINKPKAKAIALSVSNKESSLNGEDVPERWANVLKHCSQLRDWTTAMQDGLQISYSAWFKLATHLHILGDWGYRQFHELSATDSRYDVEQTDRLWDNVSYAPTTCANMSCGKTPEGCGIPAGKVSPSVWAYRYGNKKSDVQTIQTNNRQLKNVAADVMTAVLKGTANNPAVFERDDELVYISSAGAIKLFTKESFRVTAGKYADFITETRNPKGEIVKKGVALHEDIVGEILANPNKSELQLPILKGVVYAPVVTRAGVEDTPGYLPNAQVFYTQPDGAFNIERFNNPGDSVQDALEYIFDIILAGFPFDSQASKVHTLCMLLQPLVRPIIGEAPTPLYLIEAPRRASGKSMLAETCAVFTNPNIGAMTAPRAGQNSEDEWRKRITAALLLGKPHVYIDNLAGRVESESLASALTSVTYLDRQLQQSKILTLPNYATWIATGNNQELHSDINSRRITIRIDAQAENPELRTGFKCPDPKGYVQKHRGEALSNLLVLIDYWIAQGMPRYKGKRVWSRYAKWTSVMGGICDCLGMYGILDNYSDSQKNADPETLAWREFIELWAEKYSTKRVTVNEDLYSIAIGGEDTMFDKVTAPGVLAEICYGATHHSRLVKLGKGLERQRECVYAGYKIKSQPGRIQAWWLEKVEDLTTGEISGTAMTPAIADWEKTAQKLIDSPIEPLKWE